MTWPGGVDDRIRVKVENTLLQLFQVGVELESCVTGGESGDEDVDAAVIGLIVLEVGVNNFERVVVGESYLVNDVERIGDQGEEFVWRVNDFSGGFV